MPNTKSAKKRLRQDQERRERNRAVKSAVKTQIKRVINAVRQGNLELAETEYRMAARKLDRAGDRGVIHKNMASRRKSRLQAVIKAAKAKAVAA
jgi:small subunit ribosomal protein S20